MAGKKKRAAGPPKRRTVHRRPIHSLPALLSSLTTRSYFELDKDEQKLLRKAHEHGFRIDGWSFIPHPDVIDALRVTGQALVRHILTIETLRAKIYFAVRTLLQSVQINVSSYYTGGSADFVCDITSTKEEYAQFYEELSRVLIAAGVERLEEVKKIVCVWRVEEPFVLSRQELARIARPNPEILKEIVADPAKFETLYRDYTGTAARTMFKNDRALRKYVNDLRSANAIVGFRPLLDGCRFVDREYVPLCHGGRPLENLLEKRRPEASAILQPTIELLSVLPVQPTDQVEKEVSHIFINEYNNPGERNDWRSKVYEALGDELNVFTFPLEGTLNESPIILSDLPEALSRAKQYVGDLEIGTLSHSAAPKTPPVIALGAEALGGQGVTLGISGSGKTNTDCVLITEASRYLKRIVVVDSLKSHSLRDKHDAFPASVKQRIQYTRIEAAADQSGINEAVEAGFAREGINVLEADESLFQGMVDACITAVEATSVNSGNTPRVVEGMLLIQEANDAFGSGPERRRRVDRLESLLTKTYRKGWCVWLSTQHPSDVGYDDASAFRILRALQNRILHQLDDDDVSLASRLLGEDDNAGKKFGVLLTHMPKWTAIVRGTRSDGGTIRPLPPLTTAIRELGKDLPKAST